MYVVGGWSIWSGLFSLHKWCAGLSQVCSISLQNPPPPTTTTTPLLRIPQTGAAGPLWVFSQWTFPQSLLQDEINSLSPCLSGKCKRFSSSCNLQSPPVGSPGYLEVLSYGFWRLWRTGKGWGCPNFRLVMLKYLQALLESPFNSPILRNTHTYTHTYINTYTERENRLVPSLYIWGNSSKFPPTLWQKAKRN